jgi:hypothetical protein
MKSLVFYVILIFIINFYCCQNKKNDCLSSTNHEDKTRVIKGVIDSFYKSKDHGKPIIVIKESKVSGEFLPSYFLDHAFFSEYEVGDSLIKRAGFMDVTLIKQNGQKKIYKYNCFDNPHDTLAF